MSQDDGVSWGDVAGTPVGEGTITDRLCYQVSLSDYDGSIIRLRYKAYAYYDNGVSLMIGDIGMGEPEPSAPILAAPYNYESVTLPRPTLSVTNAVDFQGDSLEYEFEVYSDSSPSNLSANVPVLASGNEITHGRLMRNFLIMRSIGGVAGRMMAPQMVPG